MKCSGIQPCYLSHSGGWRRSITWTQEFEYSLGNIQRTLSQKERSKKMSEWGRESKLERGYILEYTIIS